MHLDVGTDIPSDYIHYLLTASDVTFGLLEPVQITDEDSKYNYLPSLMEDMESFGIGEKGLPLCNDNDNIYYMTKDGKIFLYSSEENQDIDQWDNLADWILNEWILEKKL